jgi:hypothetical protein
MTDSASLTQTARIVDTLYRHAEAMDTKDWDAFRAVLADELDIDYSAHRPGQAFTTTADDWTAHVARRLGRLTATQHCVSNPRVEVEGASARASAYIRADHLLGRGPEQRRYTIGGRYLDRLALVDDRWLLTSVTLDAWWYEGDRSVLELPPD